MSAATLPTSDFLNLRFDVGSEVAFLARIAALARADGFSFVATPNVDHMIRLHEEENPATSPLWAAYRRAALTICDSRILTRLAVRSGIDLPAVPGSDLTARIVHSQEFAGMQCHVIGGDAAMLAALQRQFPGLRWSQFEPPHNVLRDPAAQQAIVRSVTAARADVTFMAIGSPQSELVCAQILDAGAARGVALCIGASLEFVTGVKRRAPAVLQRLSLEWLFRLATEPRRLWRRYLIVAPRIFTIWKRWDTTTRPGVLSRQ